jgi:hypothetical protein
MKVFGISSPVSIRGRGIGFEQPQRPDHTCRVRLLLKKEWGDQVGIISSLICVSFDHTYFLGAAFDRQSIEKRTRARSGKGAAFTSSNWVTNPTRVLAESPPGITDAFAAGQNQLQLRPICLKSNLRHHTTAQRLLIQIRQRPRQVKDFR